MSVSVVSPVFIGRREEIAALGAPMGRAQAGEPAFALIGGEAGVGKTRLVSELTARASVAGFLVLTGQCVELGAEGLPLAPLVDALRTLARTTSPEVLAKVLGPAGAGLSRLPPELSPAGVVRPAGEDIQTAQLLELVLGLLVRLSMTRPVMLVTEDLHWADQSTLDLIAFLARSLRAARVLLAATYRSDELHRRHPLRPLLTGWERARSVDRIDLRRFSRSEVTAQLAAILGDHSAPGVADVVFDRSGGNAYLVEEIASVVRRDGDPADLPPATRCTRTCCRASGSVSTRPGLRPGAAASIGGIARRPAADQPGWRSRHPHRLRGGGRRLRPAAAARAQRPARPRPAGDVRPGKERAERTRLCVTFDEDRSDKPPVAIVTSGRPSPRCPTPGMRSVPVCLVRVLESDIVTDVTVIATAAITGAVGLTAALMQMLTNLRQTDAERDRHTADAKAQRRSERQAAYISVMDLLVDFGWDSAFPSQDYNVVESFNKPFLHAANRVRLYGSPAAVAAIDQIQAGLAAMNRRDAAAEALFSNGADAFTLAAREDVGPQPGDGLKEVIFHQGIGLPAE